MLKVEKAVAEGKSDAVESFWTFVNNNGTPLVETLNDDKANSLVIFIRRGDAETKNVFSHRLNISLAHRKHTNTKKQA